MMWIVSAAELDLACERLFLSRFSVCASDNAAIL
jgi:hypothetical protein